MDLKTPAGLHNKAQGRRGAAHLGFRSTFGVRTPNGVPHTFLALAADRVKPRWGLNRNHHNLGYAALRRPQALL